MDAATAGIDPESTAAELVATPAKDRTRRLEQIWLLLWPLLLALHLFPIRTRLERELLLATLAAIWIGGTALFWRKIWVKIAGIGAGVALIALAALPGRPEAPAALRAEYLRSLQTYEGTIYIWGGEAATGIDCSGLVRVAMVDALLRTGLKEANPALLRQAIALWWNDCSAEELGKGYAGRLVPVTVTNGLNLLDHSTLQPGDIAVTRSGKHTMAYLGNNQWIEADPDPMRVVVAKAPGTLPWFNVGMHILRWKLLASN
jgi:Cell wall-associated hydrolases (invasion-associated proteins)